MNEQSSLPEDSLKTVIAAVNIGTSKRSIKTRNNVQFFLDDMRDSAMMESPQSRKTAHVASELLQLVTTDGGNLSGFIEYYSTLSREEQLHTIESMLHDCEGAHVPGSMQRFVEAAMGGKLPPRFSGEMQAEEKWDGQNILDIFHKLMVAHADQVLHEVDVAIALAEIKSAQKSGYPVVFH